MSAARRAESWTGASPSPSNDREPRLPSADGQEGQDPRSVYLASLRSAEHQALDAVHLGPQPRRLHRESTQVLCLGQAEVEGALRPARDPLMSPTSRCCYGSVVQGVRPPYVALGTRCWVLRTCRPSRRTACSSCGRAKPSARLQCGGASPALPRASRGRGLHRR